MSKNSATASTPLSAGLRRFVYFTAVNTGAAIMIIQILGAKMLAPYIGTSHFVWTAQIAVTLVALSAGYYFGGWLVDKSARLGRLYTCILLAAIYVAVFIGFIEPVAYWCLRYKLAMGSLLTSFLLFFIPLALLAMTCPYLVRVLTSSVQNVGGTAGRLTAISTVGSVLGTILIGYVVVPYIRNSLMMYLTAAVLLGIVLVYFAVWGRSEGNPVLLALGSLILLAAGAGGVRLEGLSKTQGWKELFRGNSNFGRLQVIEHPSGRQRYYLNDFLTQNTYDPETRQSTSLFTYMLHDLAVAYTPRLERVLCIGMGVGIVPMQLARAGVQVDVVEINDGVVPVAERFFDFDRSKVRLEIGDGRSFLNSAPAATYDAVVLDAFLGDSSPSHLMTREAFASMRRTLTPEGVLVINSFGDFEEGRDFFTASLEKTLKAVFPGVRIHARGSGNVFFVASNQAELRVFRPPDFTQVHPSKRWEAETVFNKIMTTQPASGIVLTDDFNPVEFHDAENRENWRKQLTAWMRSL